jgi:hypothetical protein
MPKSLIPKSLTKQGFRVSHSIARMDLTPGEKAKFGAAWLANKIAIIPTVEVVSLVLGVSQQAVTQARKHQEPASLPEGMLAWGLMTSTPDERAAVFAEFEPLVWAGLELVADAQR